MPKIVRVEEIDHPTHYNSHPSGIECIEIVRHMRFNEGNVVKYLWRSGLKTIQDGDSAVARLKDLEKARWYLNDAIEMAEREVRDNEETT